MKKMKRICVYPPLIDDRKHSVVEKSKYKSHTIPSKICLLKSLKPWTRFITENGDTTYSEKKLDMTADKDFFDKQ
jgi:hypothetical protein